MERDARSPGAPGKSSTTARYVSRATESSGTPLPSPMRDRFEASLGTDLSAVRLHTGAESAAASEAVQARGFALGNDIHFGAGQYDPASEGGMFLIAHEVAHTVQQRGGAPVTQTKLEISTPGDAAEQEADHAASEMLRGRPASISVSASGLHRFGATAATDKTTGEIADKNEACHENQTLNAAGDAGYNDDDAAQIYSGNWQRDMNQLLIPKLDIVAPAIYELMQILHAAHFGDVIPGGEEELGTYDPNEHLDAPGDLKAGDIYDQRGDSAGTNQTLAEGHGLDPDAALADSHPDYVAEGERIKAANMGTYSGAEALADSDRPAFAVDESGLPAYLQVARNQLKATLNKALGVYPTDRDRALRMAGEALHTLQDYFAHSNFCEVAINKTLEERPEMRGDLGIGDEKLDSYVHAVGSPDENLTTAAGREVIMTGSFSIKDTLMSVKEKLTRECQNNDPFAKAGKGGGMAHGVCAWMDSHPEYVPGAAGIITAAGIGLKGLITVVEPILTATGGVRAGAALAEGAAEGAWAFGKGIWDGKGVRGAASDAGGELTEGAAEAARRMNAMTSFTAEVNARANAMITGEAGACTKLYDYVNDTTYGITLANIVREVPVVGPDAAKKVEKWEEDFRKDLREKGSALWEQATGKVVQEIGEAAEQEAGATQGSTVTNPETQSKVMTGPTHTDIAKDFDPHEQRSDDHDHSDHRHGGAWLAGMANKLATKASKDMLAEFQAACDAIDRGEEPAAIGASVDRWFAHPDEHPELWQDEVTATLEADGDEGEELREELARRTSLPASEQSPAAHHDE